MNRKYMKINLFNYTITIKKKKRKQPKKSYGGGRGKLCLHAPVAPDGYIHRWIREEVIKTSHIKKSAINLVKAKKYKQSFPTVEEGRFKGYIGIGGLILARMPARFERWK